ncbi:MAG: ATP-binding protein, partial [Anaerolineae bacterium]
PQRPQPPQSLQDLLLEVVSAPDGDGASAVQFETSLADPLFLPSSLTEQIVRIVQEATLNARRHAGGSAIHVRLERQSGSFVITVADDGPGFDPAAVPAGEHFGLDIMRARAARIGGRMEVDSAPGRGTRVRLTWAAGAALEPASPLHALAGRPSPAKVGNQT